MKHAVIGADGFIGANLARRLPGAILTTRRGAYLDGRWSLDLADPGQLPDVRTVYLCAGVNGALTCARDPQGSWRVNVDGTIRVAEAYRDRAFVVWLSSTTVEWGADHYARQKRTAETVLRAMPHVGIIRAGRVTQANVGALCDEMIRVAEARLAGVTPWNIDEQPYDQGLHVVQAARRAAA